MGREENVVDYAPHYLRHPERYQVTPRGHAGEWHRRVLVPLIVPPRTIVKRTQIRLEIRARPLPEIQARDGRGVRGRTRSSYRALQYLAWRKVVGAPTVQGPDLPRRALEYCTPAR